MVDDVLLTAADVARRLNTSIHTVRYWNASGTGPPSAKIGRRRLYRSSELEAWVDAQFAAVSDGRSK
jgi:DNA-binding transcriptional MerR regulator